MNSLWRTIAVGALVAADSTSGFGQAAEQPVVLTIEINNAVFYRGDVTDPAKMARDPGVTTPGPSRAFQYSVAVSDIVAVNGKPVKGLLTQRTSALIARVNPQPGQTIADHDGNGPYLSFFQFQGFDGTWIGSLWTGGGLPGPSHAILAGNGAFFGVAGEHREWEQVTPTRTASVTEDPANRRLNGGGKGRTVYYGGRSGGPAAVRTRGPRGLGAEPSEHLHGLRCGGVSRTPVYRHGSAGRPVAQGPNSRQVRSASGVIRSEPDSNSPLCHPLARSLTVTA